MIEIRHVTKTYTRGGQIVPVLNDLSLVVQTGEFLALMGPSGSGKSTLLNLIAGIDRPDRGEILMDGRDIAKLSESELAKWRANNVGFIFQFYNLIPVLTAFENVALPLQLTSLSESEKKSRVTKALAMVGLSDRMDHTPNELSGGQQQRVAIARAIVNQPEIIFADEPTGNLDTRSSYEIIALFQQLNRQGKTVVLVTHEPDIAEYAKRIIKITDGGIVSDQANASPKNAALALDQLPKEASNESK